MAIEQFEEGSNKKSNRKQGNFPTEPKRITYA